MRSDVNNSRRAIWLPIILSAVLCTGILIGTYLRNNNENRRFTIYPRTDKLSTILGLITSEYVDTVDREKLSDEAIGAILKDLDPHSVYIPASELQAVNEPLEGNFSGIGVQFNIQNDTVAIIQTIANGPSERIGIKAGDRIVRVNDTLVAGVKMESNAIMKRLKGPRGTKVKVGIHRRGVKGLLDFEIVRDQIPIYSVDVAYMINSGTGYIKINSFSQTTYEEFMTAVKKLHEEGMKNMVLDLRGNGGGYMNACTNIADEFFGNNELIVYTKGRSRPKTEARARPGGACLSDSVIVLLDEWSASASEILAGAIQDNDRGVIMGRRSFGKGLVQEQVPIADGSALRLTVARYYTPSGRCIQKPYNKGMDAYYHELMDRYENGEFTKPDSSKLADTVKYRTPKGRILYGGGGIMPDVFIPLDTTGYTPWYNTVRNKGTLYSFAFLYSDNNRQALEKYTDWKSLDQYLDKQNLLNQFITYSSAKGIKPVTSEIQAAKQLALTEMKAYIARNIIDNEGFYPILGKTDRTLQQAAGYYK
jgi:carboxyl-terminal processing protease